MTCAGFAKAQTHLPVMSDPTRDAQRLKLAELTDQRVEIVLISGKFALAIFIHEDGGRRAFRCTQNC
jgi:3-deoxy-D-arabino-heptulosonate 7-phosphate (DAHP) synthase